MRLSALIRPAVALCALASFAFAGCRGGDAAAETQEKDADGKSAKTPVEAVPVEVVTLARGSIEQVLRFTAHLEAERTVEVRSEAARTIVALHVEEGARVGRGAPLARLEDDQQRTAVARAESQLEQAARERERQAKLFEGQMLSEQAMNQADHDRAQLELALADAKRELSYTVVRAPIAGTVTRRMVKQGDRISPNQHLFDLIDFESLVALVYVPERELPRLALGQSARLVSPAAPGRSFSGRIERIAPVVDPKSGTVKVTVAVPFEDGLRPGMLLEVELVTAIESAALLVPKRALVPEGTQLALWRMVGDDSVERVFVTAVLEDREKIAVGTEVAEGDRVVLAGQAGLKSGAKVKIVGGTDASD